MQLTRSLASDLVEAATNGSTAKVDELLALPQAASFIDLNVGDAGATALTAAVHARSLDVVHVLLQAGADANSCDGQGRTPLMIAAYNCYADCFAPLLDRGADATVKASNGWTAILFACGAPSVHGQCEAVKSLIELSEAHGKERDDLELQAALGIARTGARHDVVKLLAERLEDELGCFTPRHGPAEA